MNLFRMIKVVRGLLAERLADSTRTQAYTNDPGSGTSVSLSMTDTTDFVVGAMVTVSSSAGSEAATVAAVVANTSITVDQLTLNHTTSAPLVRLDVPKDRWGYWTDSELIDYIQMAERHYYAILIELEESFFRTTANFNFTANSNEFSFPSDFRRVKGLWRLDSDGTKAYKIERISSSEQSRYSGSTQTPYVWWPAATKFYLSPTPGAAETTAMQLDYIQNITVMANGEDVCSLPDEWLNCVIARSALLACAKNGDLAVVVRSFLEDAEKTAVLGVGRDSGAQHAHIQYEQ